MSEFINFYKCDQCGEEWQMEYLHCCGDRCPNCDSANEPIEVIDKDEALT